MQNLLPLAEGEVIQTLMPLPEDEDTWGNFHVMFATAGGNVRRNALSDFAIVKSNGKIAMKLDEGDHIIGVRLCQEEEDVLLTARQGKCIRFPVTEVRVFKGRDSTGVRGIRLEDGDDVITRGQFRVFVDANAEIDFAMSKQIKRMRAYQRAFSRVDLDRDGTLSWEEYLSVLRSRGGRS